MMMIENLFDEIVVHFSESIFQVNKSNDNRALFYACLVDNGCHHRSVFKNP